MYSEEHGRLGVSKGALKSEVPQSQINLVDILENIAVPKARVGCTLSSDKNGYFLQRLVVAIG